MSEKQCSHPDCNSIKDLFGVNGRDWCADHADYAFSKTLAPLKTALAGQSPSKEG